MQVKRELHNNTLSLPTIKSMQLSELNLFCSLINPKREATRDVIAPNDRLSFVIPEDQKTTDGKKRKAIIAAYVSLG